MAQKTQSKTLKVYLKKKNLIIIIALKILGKFLCKQNCLKINEFPILDQHDIERYCLFYKKMKRL